MEFFLEQFSLQFHRALIIRVNYKHPALDFNHLILLTPFQVPVKFTNETQSVFLQLSCV